MTDSSVIVRSEATGDKAGIYRVHAAAFPTDLEARLAERLRVAGRLDISVVALVENEIVGHVAFSPVTIGGRASEGLGMGPLAVLPAHQRRGIGGQLIEQGLTACRTANVGFVVVLGDPAYYCRFGFVAARTRNLKDEYQGGSAFQVIELTAGGIPAGGGLVQYAPEFAIFS